MANDDLTEGNRLSDMAFDEVSLVTRGANQDAKVVLFKGDLEDDGSNGGDDLSKGCQTDHRGLKKRERCPDCGMVSTGKQGKMRKASMLDKAYELLKGEGFDDTVLDGLEDAIHEPDDPGSTLDDAPTTPVNKENVMPKATDTIDAPERPDLSALPEDVRKALEGYMDEAEGTIGELRKDNEELAEALDEFDEGEGDEFDDDGEPVGKSDLAAMTPEDIAKLDPAMQAIVKAAQAQAEELAEVKKTAESERTRREMTEATELAKSVTTHVGTDNDKLAAALHSIRKNCGEDTHKVIVETLRSANEVAKSGNAVGGEHGGDDGDSSHLSKSSSKIEARAAEIVKADPSISKEEAIVKAAQEDPEAYREYAKQFRNPVAE